ncbi:MAG: tRNA pseudouridine(55) synthase TruB [Candidatus Magasanikbacteria bacterium RIFOXYC2_FULL_40_16]|uniref:tRNA pseudouridine synthase B n=3 Tax=Candidatus Magasanikiibacteriota TaxID=1752731 RepID=A0A1F6NJV8_9BACT|nr:MAG: tRNA pseudouridine(55) synthase TruB [Candidatus Magasanikbacteria bacterium RIFOXYA2_FULL_40_20]OGH84138.1 MAG: tRNA pseudouridine(55) synthase TruB [Candidatus Magasanikbacteria bacterium RIFOXYB1_FULL_40_15]OGH87142.1 MAG: tRNA pseudouridine(55) synthase TruB [Candidatus Magasanikbacteria bacterium RIFOXYA1_FULL_40_8]OGH89174.1 MAG: tRNA pseudouridine(55) synthase TruB [Candidatus Magasanikbacteria bacterium RIFOXYC2_FULL_40_16]
MLYLMSYVLVDKPKTWTSHDVVGYLRKVLKIKKIGHAGTLDPFATGLLIVGVGRESTKRLDEFKNLLKTYIATLQLGAISDTGDSTGVITNLPQPLLTKEGHALSPPTKGELEGVLDSFIGEQDQIPPMYSAKKIEGKKLYELARKGIEIERKPNKINIYEIKLLEYSYPQLKIEVICSAGTYIRTLAQDIGAALDVGAYCDELERTKIGDYSIKDGVNPKKISKENYEDFILKETGF